MFSRQHGQNCRQYFNTISSSTLQDIDSLSRLVRELRECGLADASRRTLKDLRALTESFDSYRSTDVASRIDKDLWLQILDLHALCIRQLLALTQRGSSRTEKLEHLMSTIFHIFDKSRAFTPGSALGRQLALALLRADSLLCYSHLLEAWTAAWPSALERRLQLVAQISIFLSSCTGMTLASDRPLQPHDQEPHGTALYDACLQALSSSRLLEHVSRACLLALALVATDNQMAEVRRGVVGIMATVLDAVRQLAANQRAIEEGWGGSGGEGPPLDDDPVVQRMMRQARAVLSGPNLQFLIGREVIAARLRLTNGQGPLYGLQRAMVPELLTDPRSGPGGSASGAQTRLLSRLGAASLVWHLVIPDRQGRGAAGPAAAAQPEVPVLPYKPVNIFDMVLEALAAVVGPDTLVEHLPGASQLTLVEPAMLLVRLTRWMRRRHVAARLGRLWEVLVELLKRPHVQLQYSEHRPLQLIGGLLRLELQMAPPQAGGAQGGVPAAAHDGAAPAHINVVAAHQGPGCSPNLRCALDAGFLRAVEKLLRGWARSDASIKGETSCLCTVNHLLRWPCVWTAVLAHGSVQEVASLIVTLRRLGELFKDRGFEAMSRAGNNDPNEHQDAEVVVTAYMAALLEQQAVVLLPPAGGMALALNDALEAGGLPSFAGAVDQLGGRPTPDSEAAQQQRVLAVFAVLQWLPDALWLARVVDTWFSVEMGKAVLQWVLEASLQCLVARDRGGANEAGPSSGPQEAPSRPSGPGTVAYVAWVTFLMMGVDFLAWINKYLAQLREMEAGRQDPAGLDGLASGSQRGEADGDVGQEGDPQAAGKDSCGFAPERLLPAVLDVVEVLAVAMPRTAQSYVSWAGAAAATAAATEKPTAAAAAAAPTSTGGPHTGRVPYQQADSCQATAPQRARDIVLDEWFRGVLLREGRQGLLSVLEAWADGKEQGDGGAAASDVPPSGATLEQRTPQLAALREEVERKHDIANLRDLPSPHAAAALVEHKGKIKLCANPGCTNLEGDSEADLAGRKTCRFCQAVSYCSGDCQLEHWNSQHRSECPGAAQLQHPPDSLVT